MHRSAATALRLPGRRRLRMRLVFITYLCVIAAGLVYTLAIALRHQ